MTPDFISSPNYNARNRAIDTIILHYTGMESGQAALDRLCDPGAKVSAHYMIWETGEITQLVDERHRAWHAGLGSWQGDSDLNTCSIGIEIINGGHNFPLETGELPPYPDLQIKAVIALCQSILTRHSIAASRIIGHSDMAPARKEDPGEHFPWAQLAKAGIGLWPDESAALVSENEAAELPDDALSIGQSHSMIRPLKSRLRTIGYALADGGVYDKELAAVLLAFQRHWAPEYLTGYPCRESLKRIEALSKSVPNFKHQPNFRQQEG